MTSSETTKADAPAPLSMIERINSQAPITYADTAFTGQFDPEPARHKAGWASDIFENNTRCHEYLLLSLEPQVGELDDWKKLYNEPMTPGEVAFQKRKTKVEGVAPPAGLHYSGFIFSLENVVRLLQVIALLAALTLPASLVLMTLFSFQSMVKWMFSAPVSLILTATVPGAVWWIFNQIIESGWPARYSRAARPYISFRRDLGEVHIRSWRKIHKIPFAELQAGAVTTFDVQTKLKKLAFGVKHKHSKLSVAMEGSLTATTPAGRWALCVRWELLQHYMDTTRPLPDIPMLEPYRHLDPTTRAWDEKHQRPRWVWMTMSNETYSQLRSAALKAAETYPFSAPGHKPDPGDRECWQPAGDGNHWYQLG